MFAAIPAHRFAPIAFKCETAALILTALISVIMPRICRPISRSLTENDSLVDEKTLFPTLTTVAETELPVSEAEVAVVLKFTPVTDHDMAFIVT